MRRALLVFALLAPGSAAAQAPEWIDNDPPFLQQRYLLAPVKLLASDYPSAARKAGVEGLVVIQIGIADDGSISDCKIRKSSGDASLDAAACQVYRQRARFNAVEKPRKGWLPRTEFAPVRWVIRPRPAPPSDPLAVLNGFSAAYPQVRLNAPAIIDPAASCKEDTVSRLRICMLPDRDSSQFMPPVRFFNFRQVVGFDGIVTAVYGITNTTNLVGRQTVSERFGPPCDDEIAGFGHISATTYRAPDALIVMFDQSMTVYSLPRARKLPGYEHKDIRARCAI